MAYAEKINSQWIEKTPRRFRNERNASIPQAKLADEGLHEVTVDPKPDVNLGQTIEQGPIVEREGLPFRTWTVRDKTSEELQRDQEQFAKQVKAECKRRILAVADAETQQNIAQAGILYSAFRLNGMTEAEALSQAGLIAGDMTTAADFRGWVAAMSQTAGALIMAGDDTYQDDTHWPPVSDGVAELAERF